MSAQPDFMQADPTVYGFDFNALAGVSGGVPDSDGEAVHYDEVMRTGNDAVPSSMGALQMRAQPAQPPQGHADTIPGFPWQGHPEIAYSQPFTGPDGTSPMRRGGPNVGAYAAAPQEPRTYTGSAYPQAVPGTYVPNQGQPSIGGYAGVDLGYLDQYLGAVSKEERMDRRMDRKLARQERKDAPVDVRDPDGVYVYRLHSDGMIEIVVSGNPRVLPVGSRLFSNDSRWHAIIGQVGSWKQNKARQRSATMSAIAQGITSITQAATGGKKKGKGRKAGPGQDYSPAPEPSGLPGWVVPVAVGGVALTLLVVVMQSGKKGK